MVRRYTNGKYHKDIDSSCAIKTPLMRVPARVIISFVRVSFFRFSLFLGVGLRKGVERFHPCTYLATNLTFFPILRG